MAKPIILSEEPITMAQLKEELKITKEKEKELNFRANKTEEYLNKFVQLDAKKAEELKQKLEGLKISRLKPEMIVKIIDLLPKTVDELKVILQGYVVSVSKDDAKKIVKAVNDYIPAK
jgi:DNA-directed RNA polymerase subunit F